MCPNPMTVWIREIKREIWIERDTHRENDMKETDWSDVPTNQGTTGNHRKLGDEEGPSSIAFRRTWPCQHFDLGLLASRTMRE